MVSTSDKYFIDNYVTKYEKQVPHLLNIFQGKIGSWLVEDINDAKLMTALEFDVNTKTQVTEEPPDLSKQINLRRDMLGLLYCKRLQSLLAFKLKPNYVGDSIILRSFSSIKLVDNSKKDVEEQKKISFTVSYLTNSCGLPLESAVSVSKHVKFLSPERPDVVLRLLRDHGFANTHISKLVKKLPSVLLAKPEETLLPKLEFLHSIGVSSSDITNTICWNPNFLSRSLQKCIIPCYNSLKSFLDNDDKKSLKVFRQTSWITMHNLQKNIVANASILREHGVPPSTISQLLTCYPSVMALNVDNGVGVLPFEQMMMMSGLWNNLAIRKFPRTCRQLSYVHVIVYGSVHSWMAKASASSSVQAAAVTALSIHVPQNQGHSCVLKASDFDMSVQTLAGFPPLGLLELLRVGTDNYSFPKLDKSFTHAYAYGHVEAFSQP
ncbi:hypothetical protein EZV62_010617 [Acer yangbiense]|uniref:Uncharacterized protein n=1 Tax=Acer yangbiense TaxID=1000413 RepID=A0A5C7I289_9ROSI|nr:hypothetical protein EZV62_010617 [Acer yangbiense]